MSGLGWFFTFGFAVLYIILVFTVCMITFRKGHVLLGVFGIFLPFLWVIGALLPPTASSQYARA